jgi:UDP-N-acetyl-D-glucosamine dehydrogenase
MKGIDALIFAVRHKDYLNLEPDEVIDMIGNPVAVIDCFGVLDDRKIKQYLRLGCEVKGLGRGHIRRMKDEIKKNQ